MRANQIVDGADANQILRSWWRIIVTRRGLPDGRDEYFVRHDIYPFLFSPGFSAAGFDLWESQVQSKLRTIATRALDNWDSLKIFVGDANDNPPNFEEVLDVEFDQNHLANIQDQTIQAVIANLNNR